MLLFGCAGLIVLLSVFNGFSEQLRSIHKSFDPDIVILPSEGKTYPINDSLRSIIRSVEGVAITTEVIEDDVYITYKGNQRIARFKGVESNFLVQNKVGESLLMGEASVNKTIMTRERPSDDPEELVIDQALIGLGIQYDLDIALKDQFNSLQLFYPKRKHLITSDKSLNKVGLQPAGVFQIERQYDDHYLFIPIALAEQLTDNVNRRSFIEVKASPDFDVEDVSKSLQMTLGNTYKVLSGDEQHNTLYKAIQIEKLVAYLGFIVVLFVASLNLYIAISMLIVSKEKDVAILMAMGATINKVKRIFLIESMLIAFSGTLIGLFLGWLVCFAQQNYNIVKLGVDSAVINAFPIELRLQDFIITGTTSFLVALLISLRPIQKIATIRIQNHL